MGLVHNDPVLFTSPSRATPCLQIGGVAEWLIAAVLKTVVPLRVPGVRIPPPPPEFERIKRCSFVPTRRVIASSVSLNFPESHSFCLEGLKDRWSYFRLHVSYEVTPCAGRFLTKVFGYVTLQ
jgi:hypothetical protein